MAYDEKREAQDLSSIAYHASELLRAAETYLNQADAADAKRIQDLLGRKIEGGTPGQTVLSTLWTLIATAADIIDKRGPLDPGEVIHT